MDTLIEYLKAVGPFTAPVCVVLVVGMTLVLRDRGRLLMIIEDRDREIRDLRERLTDARVEMARLYQESAAATREALGKLTAAIQGLRGVQEG